MNDSDIIFADPYLKKAKKNTVLPDDSHFACAYELDLVIDQVDEAAFLRRTATTDELWIGDGKYPLDRTGIPDGTASAEDYKGVKLSNIGCVFALRRKGKKLTACLNLLNRLFRSRYGFVYPNGLVAPGIVDKSAFDNLIGQINEEYEKNREKARSEETEIIKVARELGLSPRPTGDGPSHWAANCPETNHYLLIDATENAFGCGYCKRKGAVKELRAFVKERKSQKKELQQTFVKMPTEL